MKNQHQVRMFGIKSNLVYFIVVETYRIHTNLTNQDVNWFKFASDKYVFLTQMFLFESQGKGHHVQYKKSHNENSLKATKDSNRVLRYFSANLFYLRIRTIPREESGSTSECKHNPNFFSISSGLGTTPIFNVSSGRHGVSKQIFLLFMRNQSTFNVASTEYAIVEVLRKTLEVFPFSGYE